MRKSGSLIAPTAVVAGVVALALLLLQAGGATAEPVKLPEASQKAVVSQTIGLTDITVSYHRPLARGRAIWGGLVPWGEVWRAGANENTTISFSDDVTIDGHPLPAGTYGLHTLPKQDEWTVIFSKNSTSWGSYFYDPAEDALRIQVKPVPAEMHEALTYEFDDPKDDAVMVALKWEKLAVPFQVGVDVKKTVLADVQRQMRSHPAFTWDGLESAAGWCADNDVNLEQALNWVDRSIRAEEHFENLATKGRILEKMGKTAEAQTILARAIDKANAQQLYAHARQLLAEGNTEEALHIFKLNAQRNPDIWFVSAGLARGYAAMGDMTNAIKSMKEALAKAPDEQKAMVQGLLQKLEKGEKI
jgi:FimV-like protein